jgi:hypothetical protein
VGLSTGFNGVVGKSNIADGVLGVSMSGSGVSGVSSTGRGVYGISNTSYAGYFDGNVYVTGTVTQNSDAHLKAGVSNLTYGLSEVMQLHPVSWTWKDKPEQGVQLGLIAQEAETVVPELVSTDKGPEQTKGINYIGLVPVTINAIQEQQREIEDQQNVISQQQEELKQQRIQINELRQLLCLDHAELAFCK